MPFFSTYRRSHEPDDPEHPSPQIAHASSLSLSTQQSEPLTLLPQNELPNTASQVTMTWNSDALHEGQQIILSRRPGNGSSPRLLQTTFVEPASPIEPPPSYDVARIPSCPATFTFSSLGGSSSAMILVPTQDSPDTRPIYHISVGHDPFLPTCFITSVVRGGNGQGEYVGGFKTIQTQQIHPSSAYNHTPISNYETVSIQGYEYPMPVIFSEGRLKNVVRVPAKEPPKSTPYEHNPP